uniref:UDP-3-O-acyl-N-acetylglucosamine deacetylase n=1 Tax=Cajanus cajan TaxID=3821 RepID=A0A151QXM1_CAJCA|nr:UDP-3-O-[3-hydroxymyristoyl] N-acetylglucosamine deacetylase [Cajanus cajan]
MEEETLEAPRFGRNSLKRRHSWRRDKSLQFSPHSSMEGIRELDEYQRDHPNWSHGNPFTGTLQKTLAGSVERRGKALHSGKVSTVRLCPERASRGRYFDFRSNSIPASVEFAQVSPLCTTLCKDGFRVRTVEHLLSALEAAGVDNCRIEIEDFDAQEHDVEIPIFDGSAREWVAAVEEVGLKVATDPEGKNVEKMAPHVNEPVYAYRNDSFLAAFPSEVVRITYGINFPQAPVIGCQWFSTPPLDNLVYSMHIALSRTFCIYEEVSSNVPPFVF